MASTLNRVELIGWLGANPEQRNFEGGALVTFSVATSRRWSDPQGGDPREETEWTRVVARGHLGELCLNALGKGSRVRVEGRLKTRQWQDRESGQGRFITEVIARDVMFLDPREASDDGAPDHELAHE